MTTTAGDIDQDERFRKILVQWRSSLVDLSGRNRLLNFRHTRAATLEITTPSARLLLDELDRGWDFASLPDEDPAEVTRPASDEQIGISANGSNGIVTQKSTAPALTRALGNLRKKSVQIFNDYGLWTLQLGIGMVTWREDGAESGNDAPLVLIPARIEHTPSGKFRLVRNEEEEPKLNPALAVKLDHLHVDWTPVTTVDPTDLDAVIEAASRCIEGRSGWSLSERVVLAPFASHKEAMYHDLLDNEAQVMSNDLVQALALGPGASLAPDRFDFEEVELDRIDEKCPPEETPLVLDADASQRQAVAAAVSGRSFVLDGPPGTGKSQTISNIIAALLHAGRSVLFVSEKAAALDVVLDRLRSVGLDSYTLALHSHNTSRTAVAKELGRALEEEPFAHQLDEASRAEARETRLALTKYATAMNEIREPFGQSLHDVLGRISALWDAPIALLSESASTNPFRARELSSRDLSTIVEATEVLARRWDVTADPSFPWRNLRRNTAHPRGLLEQTQTALRALAASVEDRRALLSDSTSDIDDAGLRHLIDMLSNLETRPAPFAPTSWLRVTDLSEEVEARIEHVQDDLRQVRSARTAARQAAGRHWQDLSPKLTAEPSAEESALAELAPRGLELSDLTETQARVLADRFVEAADRFDDLHVLLAEVAAETGVPCPSELASADALCALVALTESTRKPLPHWLTTHDVAGVESRVVDALAYRVNTFRGRLDRARHARSEALAIAGRDWERVKPSTETDPPASEKALLRLQPSGVPLDSLNRRQLRHLEAIFTGAISSLEAIESLSTDVAARVGVPVPNSIAGVRALVSVVVTSGGEDRAPEAWFHPDVLAQVRTLIAEITQASETLSELEERAFVEFRPDAVETPGLIETIERLLGGPRGFGAYFSKQTRADRRLVGSVMTSGKWSAEAYGLLPLALEWHAAHEAVTTLCESSSPLLGRYVDSLRPNLSGLRSALAHAESLEELIPEILRDNGLRASVAACLADGNPLDTGLGILTPDLTELTIKWQGLLDDPEMAGHSSALTAMSPGRTCHWLVAHLEPLSLGGLLLDEVIECVGPYGADSSEHTLAGARAAVASAQTAQLATAEFVSNGVADQSLLGSWYRGLETNLTPLCEPADLQSNGCTTSGLLRRALERADSIDGQDPSDPIEFLGDCAPDGNPETEALVEALNFTHRAAGLLSACHGDGERSARLVAVLAGAADETASLRSKSDRLRGYLRTWKELASDTRLGASGGALLELPPASVSGWLRAHLQPLSSAAQTIHAAGRVVESGSHLTLASCRSAIVAVSAAREAEARLEQRDDEHRAILGDLYSGIDTDMRQIEQARHWAVKVRRLANGGVAAPLTEAAADVMAFANPDDTIPRHYEDWRRQRDSLLECFEPERRTDLSNELSGTLADADSILEAMYRDPDGPETWLNCADALDVLRGFALDQLPSQMARRQIDAEDFPRSVERAVLTDWVDYVMDTDERLKPHRAEDRDRLVERFQLADRNLVQYANAEVIAECNARRPHSTSFGQAATLRRESQKQRRHMPVRRILDETRDVTRLIKPCFMMSPLTVSQFLPADFTFDVVIFDEASQVLPQDAVNSIYRGKSLIVAGDPRQLPPTSFFGATTDHEDDEWDEESDQGFESILDSCKASGLLRNLPLRWHYRSRHEHLIAFSNNEFYENSMITFPGALEADSDIGVQFLRVDGVYDRGGRRDNATEAAYVAQQVIHHFKTRPHMTLGVVAFSKSQADAIEAAVELARKDHPSLTSHFTDDRLDGFFVKNLESVQGDERDVIILSVGYGRDANGKLRSEFGPINREGGWRRLNVAVTRARRRVEVVASFSGDELPDSANKSVQHLKRYLQYAEHGPSILQTEAADPTAAPESPFEEEVIDALREWGYDVQPQVGVAGYRIDMAVRHPRASGMYAIGVECDGAMYHSSRAARDRDRLREAVLRDLGWNLHRIWGTDWYRNRKEAKERLRAAVESACSANPRTIRTEPVADREEGEPRESPSARPSGGALATERPAVVERGAQKVELIAATEREPRWSRPYKHIPVAELSAFRLSVARELRVGRAELQDPSAAPVVEQVVRRVVEVEGPIEEDLVFTRVRSAWSLERSGQVVQQRIRSALDAAVEGGAITRVDSAYDISGRPITDARTPTDDCARKVAHVPTIERRFVLLRMVEGSPGLGQDDLMRATARFFGWARLGADIRATLCNDIEGLVTNGELRSTGGGFVVSRTDLRDSANSESTPRSSGENDTRNEGLERLILLRLRRSQIRPTSLEPIAQAAGTTVSKVKICLRKLVEDGTIERVYSSGSGYSYRLPKTD